MDIQNFEKKWSDNIDKSNLLWRKRQLCKKCGDNKKQNCGYSHSIGELMSHKLMNKPEEKILIEPIKELKINEEVKSVVKKVSKSKIPSAVRKIVWNTYIGKNNVVGKCLCCNSEEITGTNFECGHIKSEKNGGDVSIDNLRPVCSNCNKSIGSKNMDEFMTRYKIKFPKNWNGISSN